jgi:hypothetical protein
MGSLAPLIEVQVACQLCETQHSCNAVERGEGEGGLTALNARQVRGIHRRAASDLA